MKKKKQNFAFLFFFLFAAQLFAQRPVIGRHNPIDSLTAIPVSFLEGYAIFNRQDSSLYVSDGDEWLLVGGGVSGESNTISSVGGGLALTAAIPKVGVDLRTISALATDFDVNADVLSIDPSIARDTEIITDHGLLAGLADDDHIQYALLAGRSGGQTLIGGTAASNSLTLESTSNVTKGKIRFKDILKFENDLTVLEIEGAVADLNETFVAFVEPSGGDNTITFPNNSGTVAVAASGEVTLSTTGIIGLSGTLADDNLANNVLDDLSQTALADPNADRIVFWDDSDTQYEFLTAGTGLTLSINTLSVDLGTSISTAEIDNNAVDATKLLDFTAYTLLMRNAATTGDPAAAKISALTEELTPATGDWILGEISTGELRKYNVGNLPIGGGETNTASNLGGGLANFDSKLGVDLRFNTFSADHFDLVSNLLTIEDATVTNKGIASFNSNQFSVSAGAVSMAPSILISSAITNLPEFLLEYTNADANGANIGFIKSSATPADGDNLGEIYADGLDNIGGVPRFAKINFYGDDITNLDEAGRIVFTVLMNNTDNNLLILDGYNGVVDQGEIIFNDGQKDVDFIVNYDLGETLHMYGDDGDIGIGTTANPQGKVHVKHITSSVGIVLETNETTPIFNDDLGRIAVYNNSNGADVVGELLFEADGTWAIDDHDTRFQINVTLDDAIIFGWQLASNGDVTGQHGTYHVASDKRLKKNIKTIYDALDLVKAMRGVTFEWRDERQERGYQTGMIAQELEKIIPSAVHTNESGIKAIENFELLGVLVQAIKELSDKNGRLENKIKLLEKCYSKRKL